MRLENNKWKMVKLGDCCQFFNGKAHEKQIDNNGNYIVVNSRFISSSGAIYKKTKEALFPLFKNDIVMVMSDVPKGKALAKCYLIEEDNKYSLNQRICAIRSDKVEARFLYYHLNRHPYLLNFDNGENQTNLRKEDILKCPLYIPPIEEQKRIVEILDKAFEGIAQAEANTRRNLANTRQFLANVRNNILNKNSNNWHPTTLKKEINLLSGFAFKSQFYTQSEDDISLLRGDNIMQGYLRWDNTQKWKKSEFDTFSKFKLKENDLVLAMDRPWVSAGLKYAEITSNDLPCLLVQRVARLRCCENLNNRFLFHLIGDRKFIKHILGKQTGIGVPHISGKQIESFEFLKPPLEKQKNIASLLDRIYSKTQKLETIYQRKLEAIAELKQSILEKAFTGQLSQ
ncbi:MAG: restriction endonuclease subunit S [Microcystis sp. M015S2]|uniref:restriction endonuclease subunit S n=1 Tax=unclassified Microcystis TaxID=2643300 RepID=UPI0025906F29|nr:MULTISPECIES: restriction endonuclease subunit S [unclassified Microcystis]MCA2741575.1 restriction endonuclease subunit S [Microcystis sp. M015S2]MCA2759038.1 restriction endonuclease subunit S [Microcystis sp. M145S2]